ncbi:interleukin-20 receptor subunit alpha isoform X2 [Brienomyrus brachyistius]|uniref:interleukin-20 receptor subunit alpha isoform X1 n=1 Tax=Brienomyrus brachyistius TaxID=42636 RepID=UPI0020B2F424|nr:interleukin-20 receptor subunit alpha isoform X1 [Brienomyrus brachyistius]XP_048860532.1 interleukin-20 receptor subunit alpha isoform X2 [Brienomyrus brachyistius]
MLKLIFLTALSLLSIRVTAVTPGAAVAPPQDVKFKSVNLQNIVEWSPGPGTPKGTWYTVEYAIYGEEDKAAPGQEVWRGVKACKKLRKTWCDLSDETSDLEEKYYARVRAVDKNGSSEWNHTDRFDPFLDTTFGPPVVNIVVNERHMFVNLTGPMRWSNKESNEPMAEYYPGSLMLYSLSVHNNRSGQTEIHLLDSTSKELLLQDFNNLYCISASVYFSSLPIKTQVSSKHCVTTGKDPQETRALVLTLGGILPLMIILLLLVLVGVPVYHYVFCYKQKHPPNLLVPHLPEFQQFYSDMLLKVNFIYVDNGMAESNPEDQGKANGPQKVSLHPAHQSEIEMLLAAPCSAYAAQQGPHEGVVKAESKTVVQQEVHDVEVTQSEGSDYGFVLKAQTVEEVAEDTKACLPFAGVEGQVPGDRVGGASAAYKRQWQAACPGFQEEHETEEGTIVNWDPQTGMIQLALLSDFEPELEPVEEVSLRCDNTHPFGVFSKVYIRRSLDGSTEFEDDLTKMENIWALQVNM